MSLTLTKTVTLVVEECINCGCSFAMPSTLRYHLLNHPEKSFYCPNGHSMVYRESKEERLRKEAEARLAAANQRLEQSAMQNLELQNQIKVRDKKLKRLTNGVCPCCNRSFHNLQQHMKKQHPEAIIK